MLRIAIADLPDEQRWSFLGARLGVNSHHLRGQLVGRSTTELKSTWRKACDQPDTRRCIVELIEVTSIDRSGEIILAEMLSQGAEFISGDVHTEHLLRKLRRELKRSRMKENKMAVAVIDEVERAGADAIHGS